MPDKGIIMRGRVAVTVRGYGIHQTRIISADNLGQMHILGGIFRLEAPTPGSRRRRFQW